MDKKIKMLVVPSDASGIYKFRSGDPHIYIQEHYKDQFYINIIYMKHFTNNDLVKFIKQNYIIQFH